MIINHKYVPEFGYILKVFNFIFSFKLFITDYFFKLLNTTFILYVVLTF